MAVLRTQPMHQRVFDSLRQAIAAGKHQPGSKLPSEAALVRQFKTSRITIGRALRDLQQQGYIERKAGSGSFVRVSSSPSVLLQVEGLTFGLLIPELGQTEVFDHICDGMAQSKQAATHALLWGHASRTSNQQAWDLCQQFIARKAAGVFFAPLEWGAARDETNDRIVDALEKSNIPVVLLDRDVVPFPRRSKFDLVGIDNRRAGYLITEHLLRLGSQRIGFLARPGSAPTVDARIAGWREALFANGARVDPGYVFRLDPTDLEGVRQFANGSTVDAVVCANDRTAAELLRTLTAIGRRVPEDLRVCGIDDSEFAPLLSVPLTTVRQPCREIGEAAMAAMVERVAQPELPPREILLDCSIVIRQSCGGTSNAAHGEG